MSISRIVDRDEAVRLSGNNNLYETDEWAIDDNGGTPLHLHRRLSPAVTRRLTFIMASGAEQGLVFDKDDAGNETDNLYVQATRGVRRLTRASAELLDRIIVLTDAMPNDGTLLSVLPEMIDPVPVR